MAEGGDEGLEQAESSLSEELAFLADLVDPTPTALAQTTLPGTTPSETAPTQATPTQATPKQATPTRATPITYVTSVLATPTPSTSRDVTSEELWPLGPLPTLSLYEDELLQTPPTQYTSLQKTEPQSTPIITHVQATPIQPTPSLTSALLTPPTPEIPPQKRKRGRPRKPLPVEPAEPRPKRPRGRPKGSKNKPPVVAQFAMGGRRPGTRSGEKQAEESESGNSQPSTSTGLSSATWGPSS